MAEPAGSERDSRDWAVVIAVVLISEIGLLWLLACLLVLRRRLALNRL